MNHHTQKSPLVTGLFGPVKLDYAKTPEQLFVTMRSLGITPQDLYQCGARLSPEARKALYQNPPPPSPPTPKTTSAYTKKSHAPNSKPPQPNAIQKNTSANNSKP